jgi:hypothetical protein
LNSESGHGRYGKLGRKPGCPGGVRIRKVLNFMGVWI